MAYSNSDMKIIVDASVSIWNYRSDDTLNTICKRHYFDDCILSLAVGDWIMIDSSTGATILSVREISPLELEKMR